MSEFNHHYHQLPGFLKHELSGRVGYTGGLPLSHITARHIAASDHLIATKSHGFRPINNIDDIIGGGPLGVHEMEALKAIVDSQMHLIGKNPYAASRLSNLTSESIRYLTEFKNNLWPIQARAQAAEHREAQRRAEEAARHLAQQRAAQEAARQLAQRQAEEAARQRAQQLQAQREAQEKARQLAKRQSEDAAVIAVSPHVMEAAIQYLLKVAREKLVEANKMQEVLSINASITVLVGPNVLTKAINDALKTAEIKIRAAVHSYSLATGLNSGIPATESFSAMLHAFNKNGVDTKAIGEAITWH